MPGSVRENDELVREFVRQNKISHVLDVGVGMGTYADLLNGSVDIIDGIEIWQPYITEYKLHFKYDSLWEEDARTRLPKMRGSDYDLIIFGDIMEHMSREDSLAMWKEAALIAKWGLISVPIVHYPQGAEFGNPYEVHVQDHMVPLEITKDYGPFEIAEVYSITGTFVRRFR